MKEYHPPQKVLEKYAKVLINFALGGGKGIKKGETVFIIIPEYTKPFLMEIERVILKSGGHFILHYLPNNTNRFGYGREFFETANKQQLSYFPDKYIRGLVDQVDHVMFILAETDMHALEGVDSKKIQQHGLAYKQYMNWRNHKEHQGKLTWTLGLYGTPAMANEAGLSIEEYWDQIIEACFLNDKNPIATWKKVAEQTTKTKAKLNKLQIDKVHVLGPDADLWITIGEKRQWLGGSGRNIPSFEVFTSPDWRGTEGWIKFNQPLYRNSMLIDGIELEFKKGKVVKATAKKNEKALKDMIASPNADKIGEFSLTDKKVSRITKFMAETLFDENIGGPHGNTHIALGAAYKDTHTGNPLKVSKKQWEKLGYNDSSVHTDIISTSPRRIMAYMRDGSQKLIYENGQFTL